MNKAPTLVMLPWWPRDYLSATRAMTLAERGVYTDLLFLQWDMGELPNDERRLCRMVGAYIAEFSEIWQTIRHKFVVTVTGGLVNARLERERAHALELKAASIKKAKKAACTRWTAQRSIKGNASSTAPAILEALHERCPPSPSSSPSPTQSQAESPNSEPVCVKRERKKTEPVAAVKLVEVPSPEVRIEKAFKAFPDESDDAIARMTLASLEIVQSVREALGAVSGDL